MLIIRWNRMTRATRMYGTYGSARRIKQRERKHVGSRKNTLRTSLARQNWGLRCVRDHDMEVMVTLIHFVWPVWLEKEGGLIAEDFPLRFQAYADKLAGSFGDLVSYWISFNEPTQLVHGYIKPWWQENYYMPPGMPEGTSTSGEAEAVGKLIYNLFSAHAKARVAIKEHKPSAKVGVNPLVTGSAMAPVAHG